MYCTTLGTICSRLYGIYWCMKRTEKSLESERRALANILSEDDKSEPG